MTHALRPAANRRVAVIQHGDFLAARRTIAAGLPEPYFGMNYTVGALERLFAGRAHLVISLNAPAGQTCDGHGEYVGSPCPASRLPGTVSAWAWAGEWERRLAAFRPTHLLLRTGGLPAARVLGWAARHGVNVLAVFAGYFDRSRLYHRTVNWRLARLLNSRNVARVGNHKQPATKSMIACGVRPEKAVAWDLPGGRQPKDYAPRSQPGPAGPTIFYAGSVLRAKGIFDLLEGVRRLRADGLPARLAVAGSGPDVESFRAAAGDVGGVELLGQVTNGEVFDRMRAADLVCVPSRPEFTEGFPLTLTEGLASRTPLLISDHPVFTDALSGSDGVRWFRAGDPASLAAAAREVMGDPDLYARTSAAAEEAFARLHCPLGFADLLAEWDRGD